MTLTHCPLEYADVAPVDPGGMLLNNHEFCIMRLRVNDALAGLPSGVVVWLAPPKNRSWLMRESATVR